LPTAALSTITGLAQHEVEDAAAHRSTARSSRMREFSVYVNVLLSARPDAARSTRARRWSFSTALLYCSDELRKSDVSSDVGTRTIAVFATLPSLVTVMSRCVLKRKSWESTRLADRRYTPGFVVLLELVDDLAV